MDLQLKKGLLEILVLALLKKGGDDYGYILMGKVSDFVDVSESALYPILRRLECEGELSVYSMEHNGRTRKYYRVTEKGIRRLSDSWQDWEIVKKIFNEVLGDNKND